jgi:hypothetical protein
MAIVECISGSYSDDDNITRFYALLGNLRPPWHAHAACRGAGVDMFYGPPQARPDPEALALCAECPVRQPCAEAGMREPAGVWAGTTASKRAKLRRIARSVAV